MTSRKRERCGLQTDDYLKKVLQGGYLLRELPPKERDNEQIVRAATHASPGAIVFASKRLRHSAIGMEAYLKKPMLVFSCAKLWSNDRNVMLELIQRGHGIDESFLMRLNDESNLLEDREIIQHALLRAPSYATTIQATRPHLFGDRDFVEFLVRHNGHMLQYASGSLAIDHSVVMLAVASDGQALKHASEEMTGDVEVVKIALESDGGALRYSAPGIQDDIAIVKHAISFHAVTYFDNVRKLVLSYASQRLQDNQELIDLSLKKDPTSFSLMPHSIQNRPHIAGKAVGLDNSMIYHIGPALRVEMRKLEQMIDLQAHRMNQKHVRDSINYLEKSLLLTMCCWDQVSRNHSIPEVMRQHVIEMALADDVALLKQLKYCGPVLEALTKGVNVIPLAESGWLQEWKLFSNPPFFTPNDPTALPTELAALLEC